MARCWLLILAGVASAGFISFWDWGQLPVRQSAVTEEAQTTGEQIADPESASPASAAAKLAPDLALYQEMAQRVREGKNYYTELKPRLLHYGFPVGSTFNWRLPTYAYFFAWLGSEARIQTTLLIVYGGSLLLLFAAMVQRSESRLEGWLVALLVILQFGLFTWCIDGLTYYTQEIWAAACITASIACLRKGWNLIAIAFAFAAVMLRELALPLLAAGFLVAMYHRQWTISAVWLVASGCFLAFLFWHSQQVAAQLTDAERGIKGIGQWLTFGGMDFVLLTTRMNRLWIDAPGGVLWLVWLMGLVGLMRERSLFAETLLLMCAGYFFAFLFVGMPVNMYWGLLYAPAVAIGVSQFPLALRDLYVAASFTRSSVELSAKAATL